MGEQFGKTGFFFNENAQWEYAGEGVTRSVMSYDNDMMLVVVKFKKGAVGSLHKHPHKQFSYVIKGSFEVNMNGEKRIQKVGDGYLMPPNVEHGVVALEESALVDVFVPHREDFLKH
ncbi:MAG TPA: cupin domain-containing protein [Bacteroidota bacterium]|nr:cupin domain-containing protein [Bacteroidota bacterium]